MTAMTYVFGDALSGVIIAEIPLYGVSVVEKFGGGELRGTFQYDQTGRDNAVLDAATIPGRCFVVAERDAIPIFAGYIQTRTYQSQAKSAQLFCRGFAAYPDRRLIRSDINYVNVDQMTIFRDLWILMQSDPNSIRVDVFSAFTTGVNLDLKVIASEFKSYKQVFEQIADGDTGFDWRIDTTRAGGIYVHSLRAGYPLLGSTDPSRIVFEYPGNILNYWKNETLSEAGTNIFTIGAGEGTSMLTASVSHSDLLNSGFPRFDVEISRKDVNSQTILNALARQEAIKHKVPLPAFTIQVKADRDPIFGTYTLGDACRLVIQDPKHPNVFQKDTRLVGWDYRPPSADGTEEARLLFEGDETIE